MLKIIFMGSPQIAIPSLNALHASEHKILSVITQPDQPKGRGRQLSSPPMKAAAEALGLEVWQPQQLDEVKFLEKLKKSQPDIICVVAYGKILKEEILRLPPYGCINLHFSLLPKYRGAACVSAALNHGDDESGVTSIIMDKGLDTGPILMQWTEEILVRDNTESLSKRLASLGANMLVKSIQGLEEGSLKPVPQKDSEASYAPRLKKQDGEMDWSKHAKDLWNLYRAMTPWPGVFSFLQGKRVLFSELELGKNENFAAIGSFREHASGIQVQCAEGSSLYLTKIKPEGKKVLHFKDFMRGLQNKGKQNLRFALQDKKQGTK